MKLCFACEDKVYNSGFHSGETSLGLLQAKIMQHLKVKLCSAIEGWVVVLFSELEMRDSSIYLFLI